MKKIKGLVCIVVSICIAMSSLATVSSGNQELSREFFIDPVTGAPNCMLVVGDNAAASDIISASYIATQIGTMTYYEETIASFEEQSIVFSTTSQLANITTLQTSATDKGLYDLGGTDSRMQPDSFSVLPYGCNKLPVWEYDIYIDPYISGGESWLIDNGTSYESISIDFSISESEISDISTPSASQEMPSDMPLIQATQSYPALFMRHYWGTLVNGSFTDPVGGVAYRAISYASDIENTLPACTDCIGMSSELTGIIEKDLASDLFTRSFPLYFLGETYQTLQFGTDSTGHDYMLYGIPGMESIEATPQTTIDCKNGISMLIQSIDVYDATIDVLIKNRYGSSHSLTVKENQSIRIYEEIAQGIDTTICCVSFSNITIRSKPTTLCEVYTLFPYGVVTETIYDIDDPYGQTGEYVWYLDIVPGDAVQELDLDNNPKLYENKNPSYDTVDSLTLYKRDSGYPLCVPYMELWLATPVIPSEAQSISTIQLPYVEGSAYLSIEINDQDHMNSIVDEYVKIYKKVSSEAAKIRHYVNIDPLTLMVHDGDTTPTIKSEYNLILVGGPIANNVVRDVIALGYTTLEQWLYSNGDYLFYDDVFATGKDVLIVAGKDRDATNNAARALIDILSSMR